MTSRTIPSFRGMYYICYIVTANMVDITSLISSLSKSNFQPNNPSGLFGFKIYFIHRTKFIYLGRLYYDVILQTN